MGLEERSGRTVEEMQRRFHITSGNTFKDGSHHLTSILPLNSTPTIHTGRSVTWVHGTNRLAEQVGVRTVPLAEHRFAPGTESGGIHRALTQGVDRILGHA